MSSIKDPDKKKRLAYERDRRNAYGEHSKSNQTIKKNKRLSRQATRSKSQKIENLSRYGIDEEMAEEAEANFLSQEKRAHTKEFKKIPDMPLKDYIERQKESAQKRAGRKQRSRSHNKSLKSGTPDGGAP